MSEEPDNRRVCLTTDFENELSKFLKDCVDEVCEKAWSSYFPPCHCRDEDPQNLELEEDQGNREGRIPKEYKEDEDFSEFE